MRQITKTAIIYPALIFFGCIITFLTLLSGIPLKVLKLYLMIVISIAATIISIFDTAGLLSFLLGVMPFSAGFLSFEVSIITLNPFTAGIISTFFFSSIRFPFKNDLRRYHLVDLIILLLCLSYLMTLFLFSNNIVSSGYIAFHALFVPVISYFTIRGAIFTKDELESLVFFFQLGLVVFCLCAVLKFIVELNRIYIFGQNPIGVSTLAFALFCYSINIDIKNIFFRLCLILLSVFTILFSFSRVYILFLLFSPIMNRMNKKGFSLVVLLTIFIGTLLITLLIAFNAEMFKPKTTYHEAIQIENTIGRVTNLDFLKATLYGRAITYREAFKKFLDAPIFGIGISKGERVITLHNFHLEWLQYGGFVGYLLYSSVILLHLKNIIKFIEKDSLIRANFLIIQVILVNSFANGIMHGLSPLILYIIIGINEVKINYLRSIGSNKLPVYSGIVFN